LARSKKKATAVAASDTVTFKKSDLVKKVKSFLDEHDACEGDWLNKVKVEFLGQKEANVRVEVKISATVDLEMAFEGKAPSKAEVTERIRSMMDGGDFCGFDDVDEDDFEVTKVSVED
jgi:hypothetical protein